MKIGDLSIQKCRGRIDVMMDWNELHYAFEMVSYI
jgi:hypothetical protein